VSSALSIAMHIGLSARAADDSPREQAAQGSRHFGVRGGQFRTTSPKVDLGRVWIHFGDMGVSAKLTCAGLIGTKPAAGPGPPLRYLTVPKATRRIPIAKHY
jgi:hypothetical protein